MFLFLSFCEYFCAISQENGCLRVRKALKCSQHVLNILAIEALCSYIVCSYIKKTCRFVLLFVSNNISLCAHVILTTFFFLIRCLMTIVLYRLTISLCLDGFVFRDVVFYKLLVATLSSVIRSIVVFPMHDQLHCNICNIFYEIDSIYPFSSIQHEERKKNFN